MEETAPLPDHLVVVDTIKGPLRPSTDSVPAVGTTAPVALPDGVEGTGGPLLEAGGVGGSLIHGESRGTG